MTKLIYLLDLLGIILVTAVFGSGAYLALGYTGLLDNPWPDYAIFGFIVALAMTAVVRDNLTVRCWICKSFLAWPAWCYEAPCA